MYKYYLIHLIKKKRDKKQKFDYLKLFAYHLLYEYVTQKLKAP